MAAWEPLFAPWSVASSPYTEAVNAADNRRRSPDKIQRIAQLRMDRQQRLALFCI
jgi:hypothetical protein